MCNYCFDVLAADVVAFSCDLCSVQFQRDGFSLPFRLTGTLANSSVLLLVVSAVKASVMQSVGEYQSPIRDTEHMPGISWESNGYRCM